MIALTLTYIKLRLDLTCDVRVVPLSGPRRCSHSERQKWTFEDPPRLSCCRGIRKTLCLSNDSRREPYLL